MNLKYPSTYELIFEERLQDLNGQGCFLNHKKTGARIALIANDDSNKVFSIGFRTPPKDSTGVAHILEHSVLCGSKNFPAKDPFVELAKGSLNTFLNAMTYPDRTIYPIASQNDKDFKNLMHVYMDAVLYPNIYDKKEIFDQEGWHYELDDLAGELKLNGVVYNEMKGAFSSPEQQLFRLNMNSLFPDTCYGVESGGDPTFIPDLTYEDFKEFHRSYYHPSNSYVYLYGDMDFEERLTWLDQEYFSHFDYLEVDSEIQKQDKFNQLREVIEFYSVGEGESTEGNTYLSYNTVIGETRSRELNVAFTILQYVLLEASGAPLKQALIDAGIGKDIFATYSSDYIQSKLSIVAKNSDESKKEQFMGIIRDELTRIVKEGLDEKSLRAAINFYEFRYREADYGSYPKGLMYGLKLMGSWIYDDMDLFLSLKDNPIYESLKSKIGTGYYEQLITEYLLNNTHSSLVILKPSTTLNGEKEAKEKKRLADYQAGLTTEDLNRIVAATKHLKQYQDEPSRKEDIEKIPLLSREDIGADPLPIYNKERAIEGAKTIHHDIFTNGIVYLRLCFDMSNIPGELVPYTSLLAVVLGAMNTKQYSYLELNNEVNIHTGGIYADVKSFSNKRDIEKYLPIFEITSRVVYDKISDSFRLINEMLFNTILNDSKRIKELLEEMKSRMQMTFTQSGHAVARDRAMSYSSAHGLFKENCNGIAFYDFITELLEDYQKNHSMVVQKLEDLIKMIFVKENLFISVTADEEGYQLLQKVVKNFILELPNSVDSQMVASYKKEFMTPECLNEGFKAAMQVQYVARTGNFIRAGYQYTGALKVLQMIFSYDYLWNSIRVKGGAYGAMCGFNGVDGDAYFTSYRDPNLRETNEVYKAAPEFVANFAADERDMTRNIIGTISSLDKPLTPQSAGRRSLSMYLSGVSYEDLQKEREQIINVTQEDIRELSSLVKSVLDAGNICVIGNETKVEREKELFKCVKNLMK